MKFNNKNLHQGDTQWFGIDDIPERAIKVDKQFIAASERSGSFHALFGDYDLYKFEDGFIVDVKDECILNHSLKSELEKIGVTLEEAKIIPKKDHRHSIIKKGLYYVGLQQRFDPLAGFKSKVRD